MARHRNPLPTALQIELRPWRLGEAQLAYESHGEAVRRLTDQILDSLTGLSFLKLAAIIEAYNEERGDDLHTDLVGIEPETVQNV
jgi:hypothetical protein